MQKNLPNHLNPFQWWCNLYKQFQQPWITQTWFRLQMQQNPSPNSNLSHIHSHDPVSNPYQPSTIDSHNRLFAPQPQPQPPGVDPPYVSPQQPIGYETQPNYAQQPMGYEPQLSYAHQPMAYEPQVQQGSEAAAAASYYLNLNATWAAAISQFVTTHCAAGASTPNPTNQLQKRHIWKKGPKKTKVEQSAWCEVCLINCNSKGVLDQHKLGKKHLKNIEKLTAKPAPIITAPTHVNTVNLPGLVAAPSTILPASTSLPVSSPALTPIDKPIIGPEENPEKPKPSNAQKARKKAAATEDLETKRRKVLDGGAAVVSVRACSICNVVCNSDTVFRYHLAGQKHASMMKKHGLNAGVAFAL